MSEILGTLFKYLLALLAITAVVAVLYEALSSNKVSTAVTDLTTLQTNVSQLYAGSNTATLSSTATDITANLANSSSAPSSMVSNGTLVNPWGGAVKVTVAGATSTVPPEGTIEFDSVPNGACAKMVSSLWPSMTTVSINSTSATTVTAAIQACGASTTGSSNNIIFTFNLS